MLRLLLLYLTINHRVHSIVTDEIFDDVEELKNAPADHVIPYSEHENPPEPPTKPKYIAPGQWAKSSSNKSNALDFIPTKLYAQVRQTHTRKRVPREEALRHATTDEEKENAARLKEVVTNRKVNTIYTEEGYEDAAYDHGGHVRDADINENYSDNNPTTETMPQKQKGIFNSDEINNDDFEIDTKFIIDNEVKKLEEDLDSEDKAAAKGAETEVPENLRDLTDNSDSYDYEDEQKFRESKRDYDYEDKGSDTATLPGLFSSDLEDAAAIEQSEKIAKHFTTNLPTSDFTPALKQLSSSEDESTATDYGRVFWDYFKTEKPIASNATTPIPQNFQHQISKIELQTSATPKDLADEELKYPSLSQIYESWKQKGIEVKSDEGMSPAREVSEIIETTTLTSSEDSTEIESDEQLANKKPRKHYMVMVRGPKQFNYNSQATESPHRYKRLNHNHHRHLKNNNKPEINNDLAVKNIIGLQLSASPPLGQVTYTNFLHDTYGNLINPTVTQESGLSTEQIIPGTTSHSSAISAAASSVGPTTTPPIYRYHQHQQRHHRRHHQQQQQQRPLVQRNRKHHILSLITMLPPSQISHSEYAQYYPERRSGSVKLDHDPWPDVYKNYRSVFHLNAKTLDNRKQLNTMIDKGLDGEKVLLKGENKNYQSVEEKELNRSRRKRNVEKLLVKAPRIVDAVINEEIESRFAENNAERDDDDDDDEDHEAKKNHSVSYDDKQRDKVEIEVPEYNFSDNVEARDNDEEEEYHSADVVKSQDDSAELINNKKYPFYNDNKISRGSPLKYVISPLQVPLKTHGGSEFYDSRDKYMHCDDIEADLSEELPENDEEPVANRDLKENLPRLRGLGDKISCLRDKHFDKNPLDNPLFKETRIEAPEMPEELNPVALKLAFSTYLDDSEPNVIRRVSRKPEIIDLRPSNSRTKHIDNDFENNIRNRSKIWNNHAKIYRRKYRTTTAVPDAFYQRQVYEDVMGIIKNMAHMHQPRLVASLKPPTSPRISKSNSKINHPLETLRDRNKYDQNIYTNARPTATPAPVLTVPQISWKYKLQPYRTNRVTYKTRPRMDSVSGSNVPKIVGYFKTVRVHKRSVDFSQINLNGKESGNNILARNATRRRRMRKPISTAIPETISTQASERIVYTIDDRLKHSKPRGRVRYGQFTTEGTTLNEDLRRSEPRYTPIRKFDADVHEIEYSNKNQDSSDDPRGIGEYEANVEVGDRIPITQKRRYDVHEKIEEPSTEAPVIFVADKSEETHPDQYSNDSEGSGQSEESSGALYRGEESEVNENEEENDDEEDGNENNDDEQIERPLRSDTKNSKNESGEDDDNRESSRETEPYDDEEKNVSHQSEDEEEFERFKSRPFSPFESNDDEKYSDLGPRIDKPAFYHPPFDSSESKKLSRNRGRSDRTSDESEEERVESKYTFPWHKDDSDASEESRRHEIFSGKHEYPWERRERLERQYGRAAKDDDDSKSGDEQHKSSTMIRLRKLYPWERYDVPSKGYGFSRVADYFSPMYEFDNHGFSSQFRPVKFSSRYRSKFKPPRNFIPNDDNKNSNNNVESTTFVSQIPPTPATFPSLIKETPTPAMKINTPVPVYTIRPRSRSLRTPTTTISIVTSRPIRSRLSRKRGQSIGLSNSNTKSENALENLKNRRRSRMTTLATTAVPSSNRNRTFKLAEDKSTTPSTRNIEHRSKVSKEERITKMTFADSDTSNTEHEKSSPKNEVVKKVSILTKETPEHIYRTEEVDRDGIKDRFYSILPNNNTQNSHESDKLLSIERIEMEESGNVGDIVRDSPEFDAPLPIPAKAVQLSEHGTRKVISSVSWIAENYDY